MAGAEHPISTLGPSGRAAGGGGVLQNLGSPLAQSCVFIRKRKPRSRGGSKLLGGHPAMNVGQSWARAFSLHASVSLHLVVGSCSTPELCLCLCCAWSPHALAGCPAPCALSAGTRHAVVSQLFFSDDETEAWSHAEVCFLLFSQPCTSPHSRHSAQ